jgi:hypothetical protein
MSRYDLTDFELHVIRALIEDQGATPSIPREIQPKMEALLQQTALSRA